MQPKLLLFAGLLPLLCFSCTKNDTEVPAPGPARNTTLSGNYSTGSDIRMSAPALITASGITTDTALIGAFLRRQWSADPYAAPVMTAFQLTGTPQMTTPANAAFNFGTNDTVRYSYAGGTLRMLTIRRSASEMLLETIDSFTTTLGAGRTWELGQLIDRYPDSAGLYIQGASGPGVRLGKRRFLLQLENGQPLLPQAIAYYGHYTPNVYVGSSWKVNIGQDFIPYAQIRSQLIPNDTVVVQLKQMKLVQ
ncbi:hypothetical protein EPD60_05240 [Flaviaesturariibacter flavus]|uniref:Uncharacterized protein n=1 Tax=Flaviaesturariibacter flavus TaxID=2502780 RepID=A0A4R1BJR8_9BACT|nr:hypothetical protein [Flaviaesturariibacter flavus]TCJ17600.1 hypothetical protein EPD60_05240 [Flaviaesturariibacter flavus]